ncbi:hypothetical protein C7M56_10925 [Clostridium botulinum]|uniref:Uncharacterized protein n=1 Tax=Clostridium botulinum TaxID=1491 RepID=A0ABC8CVN1_CLOBO|nr:hypothetical protein C7M56_10925 [Clostridium botulinum]
MYSKNNNKKRKDALLFIRKDKFKRLKRFKWAMALKNLRTIYRFTSLKLTQYIVGFILNAIAPLFILKEILKSINIRLAFYFTIFFIQKRMFLSNSSLKNFLRKLLQFISPSHIYR